MSTSVNMQQMKTISGEFDQLGSKLSDNEKKLSEAMASLSKIWVGEASSHYLHAFESTRTELQQMARLMTTTSQTLKTITTGYEKSENQVQDMIKSTLAKG